MIWIPLWSINELRDGGEYTSGYNAFQLDEKLKRAKSNGLMGLYALMNDLKDRDFKDPDTVDKIMMMACKTKEMDQQLMTNIYQLFLQVC